MAAKRFGLRGFSDLHYQFEIIRQGLHNNQFALESN